jgi:hypothetical protein
MILPDAPILIMIPGKYTPPAWLPASRLHAARTHMIGGVPNGRTGCLRRHIHGHENRRDLVSSASL